jgi:hypothetical protein
MTSFEVRNRIIVFSLLHLTSHDTLFQIFTGIPPWGVLAEKLIFQLVVRENERPERPDPIISERVGLTTPIWELIESAWHKEAVLRPTFQQLANVWPKSATSDSRSMMPHGTCRLRPYFHLALMPNLT